MKKKLLSVFLAVAVAFTFSFAMVGTASAAKEEGTITWSADYESCTIVDGGQTVTSDVVTKTMDDTGLITAAAQYENGNLMAVARYYNLGNVTIDTSYVDADDYIVLEQFRKTAEEISDGATLEALADAYTGFSSIDKLNPVTVLTTTQDIPYVTFTVPSDVDYWFDGSVTPIYGSSGDTYVTEGHSHGVPLIIDEIQKSTALIESIKIRIDEAKLKRVKNDQHLKLMYVLTGSNTHEIREKASESLAGRTALIEVNSFSACEKLGYKGCAFVPSIEILKKKQKQLVPRNRFEIFDEIFLGGMPEYWTLRPNRDSFFESYISTYLEKDVSRMINVRRLDDFRRFMRIVALRTSQQLDYTEIGNAVGIDARTAKGWISVLESSGIILLLQPYISNLAKRIIKKPKLYFMDTGLCSFLCGWSDSGILEASPMAGAFFETYVVSEIVKSIRNEGKKVECCLYYYRDRDKKEIDLIFVKDRKLYPIEIKKGIGKDKADKNFKVLEQYKMPIETGLIIDTSDKVFPLNKDTYYCPVGMIGL